MQNDAILKVRSIDKMRFDPLPFSNFFRSPPNDILGDAHPCQQAVNRRRALPARHLNGNGRGVVGTVERD
jgi:hypothetical protein